jgi:hypothetical protein
VECLTNPIGHFPHLYPLTSTEVARGEYDVSDVSWIYVYIGFSLQCSAFNAEMALAVGTKSLLWILQSLLYIGIRVLGLLARFVA